MGRFQNQAGLDAYFPKYAFRAGRRKTEKAPPLNPDRWGRAHLLVFLSPLLSSCLPLPPAVPAQGARGNGGTGGRRTGAKAGDGGGRAGPCRAWGRARGQRGTKGTAASVDTGIGHGGPREATTTVMEVAR